MADSTGRATVRLHRPTQDKSWMDRICFMPYSWARRFMTWRIRAA